MDALRVSAQEIAKSVHLARPVLRDRDVSSVALLEDIANPAGPDHSSRLQSERTNQTQARLTRNVFRARCAGVPSRTVRNMKANRARLHQTRSALIALSAKKVS